MFGRGGLVGITETAEDMQVLIVWVGCVKAVVGNREADGLGWSDVD
jgi:hypothetical protein